MPVRGFEALELRVALNEKMEPLLKVSYAYLPEDDMSAFIKFNNDNVEEITVQMASDANLARDIIDLRDIIIRNPLTTNRFAIAASDVASYLQQGVTAVTSMMDSNQTYTEQEAIALT